MTVGGDHNRIGTDGRPLPASLKHNNSPLRKGNLISGNLTAGVIVLGHGTIDNDSIPAAAADSEGPVHLVEQRNLVAGNWIGTDITGRRPLGNGLESHERARAVPIVRVRAVTVCEIIDGQTICRTIEIRDLLVQPFRETDDSSPEIGSPGILVAGNANQIGGPGALANTIAFNGGAGVAVEAGLAILGGAVAFTGNSIRGNSIHDNRGLGIDLGVDGVSLNDRRDADVGPNHLQNFPTIKGVQRRGKTTRVTGSLHSQPNATHTVDFYATPTGDPSGFGEGSQWLGSTAVKTNNHGDATFNIALRAETSPHSVVSATATDPAGNTSEFSFAPQGKVTARSANGQLFVTGLRNDDRAIRIAPGAAGLNSIEVTDGSETRSFTGITRGVFVSLPGRGNDALFFDGSAASWQLSGKLEVSTGDGDDQTLIAGLSAGDRATIDLGSGNDQFRVIDSVFAEDWQVHMRGGDDALDLWHVAAQKASSFDMGSGRDRVWIDALRGPAGPSGRFSGPVDIRAGAGDDSLILGGFPDFGEGEVPLNEPLLFLDLLAVDGGDGHDRLEGRFLRAPSRRLVKLEDVFFMDDPDPVP